MSTWHLAFSGNRILLARNGEELGLPDLETVAQSAGVAADALEPAPVTIPTADGVTCHAYDLPEAVEAPPETELVGLRALHALVPEAQFRAAGTAVQKLEWLRTHGFCSRCGSPSERHPREEARLCPACGHVQYPRLAPAVIVLVEREGEMLLARSPHFADGVYSTLAGFVEPGESLEEAVQREIFEEVGVHVGDIRYFGSQPWPFPHSLMIGFTARWTSGDIRMDPEEIEDAAWFTADRLPPRLPTSFSIARRLVDDFLARHTTGD